MNFPSLNIRKDNYHIKVDEKSGFKLPDDLKSRRSSIFA